MKICSFLPGGTEMVFALGLGDQLVGVSHECDYPPDARRKPVVVTSAFDYGRMTSAEIDRFVSGKVRDGESLYRVDQAKLKELAPDVILTQALCEVCAPSGPEVKTALAVVPERTKVLYLTPRSLEDIFENIRHVGEATGALEAAKKIVYDLRNRATAVQCRTHFAKRKPRVFFAEWADPIFRAGQWIPDVVELAGGVPDGATANRDSVRVDWEQVAAFRPDVIVCAPCGYHLDGALKHAELLKKCPFPDRIPAFGSGRVYAADGDAYFTRPGPRVLDGIELLAHILHPDLWEWKGPADAFRRVAL